MNETVRYGPFEAMMRATLSRSWRIFLQAGMLWLEHNAFTHAGSLAFYTLFSIAPVVIIAVAIAGILFGEEAARGEIVSQLQHLVGFEGAQAVQEAVARSRVEVAGIVPMLSGVIALVVGATTVFAQLKVSLNSIWGVMAKPHQNEILVFLKDRALSLVIVVAVGFIFLIMLVMSVALTAAIRLTESWMPFHSSVVASAELLLSFGVTILLFAVLFKILPDAYTSWRHVWEGAAITAGLFVLGRYLISLYLAYSAPASPYGAAGSLVLVLLWIYYSSLIFFFGAAVTKARTLAERQRIVASPVAICVRETVEEVGTVQPSANRRLFRLG